VVANGKNNVFTESVKKSSLLKVCIGFLLCKKLRFEKIALKYSLNLCLDLKVFFFFWGFLSIKNCTKMIKWSYLVLDKALCGI
jgi:hypothetical protein